MVKKLLVGFVVSFVGTLPLGILNLVALNISINQGYHASVIYILGVVAYEILVIQLMFWGAKWLLSKQKLLIYIRLFTVLFLLGCAYSSWTGQIVGNEIGYHTHQFMIGTNPFLLGVGMSFLNPLQFPFWAGWNVYLIANKWLKPEKPIAFLIGAASGTFCGMLLFVATAQYVITKTHASNWFSINQMFGAIFLVLAGFQLIAIVRNGT